MALAVAPALELALALAEPDCDVSALKVELALVVALDDSVIPDEELADGVRELEPEPDED